VYIIKQKKPPSKDTSGTMSNREISSIADKALRENIFEGGSIAMNPKY